MKIARILLVLALGLAACTPIDVGGLIRQPVPAASASANAEEDAVRQVIERANKAQATAFNGGDASAMRATATDTFYSDLVRTNRELSAAGATKIELVSTEFVSVSVSGDTASATTLETWRTTYNDGSSDEQTARNEYTLVLQGGTWRIDADDQTTASRDPAAPNTDPVVPAAATTSSTSSNWSGYAASGGNFTSVTATWNVPNVSATTSGADATWVGIGGLNSRDLIQAGTQATVSGGTVEYQAWIEMLPAASKAVPLSVTAGDSVTVTLTQSDASNWSIVIKNNTTSERYSTSVKYMSSNSSAEWVQEAPSVGRGLVPLDNFGTLTFTSATAVRDGSKMDLRALDARAITMINSARQPLASPSAIASDGASFSVTRTQNPSDAGAGTGRRRRG